jgi:cell division cycle protein 37
MGTAALASEARPANARDSQDALELSDDSDIEVRPNVAKPSFIRAKQNQIHVERHQQKLELDALRHERVINDELMRRVRAVMPALR